MFAVTIVKVCDTKLLERINLLFGFRMFLFRKQKLLVATTAGIKNGEMAESTVMVIVIQHYNEFCTKLCQLRKWSHKKSSQVSSHVGPFQSGAYLYWYYSLRNTYILLYKY